MRIHKKIITFSTRFFSNNEIAGRHLEFFYYSDENKFKVKQNHFERFFLERLAYATPTRSKCFHNLKLLLECE